MIQVILRQNVNGLGTRGEVVDVKDGYAQNYLIPQGLAMRASAGAIAQAATMKRAHDLRNAQDRAAAEEVAKTLVPTVIAITSKAGAEGRLYGSVTTTELSDAIREQTGIEIDRRNLVIDETVRTTGTHTARARLHSDVEFPVTFEVSGT